MEHSILKMVLVIPPRILYVLSPRSFLSLGKLSLNVKEIEAVPEKGLRLISYYYQLGRKRNRSKQCIMA